MCIWFFRSTATTSIYTYGHPLSLHDALPISRARQLHGLAPHQVQRLDAGRALVQGGDAGIARELLHAVFGDVAMATEALQRVVGALHAPFGEAGLGDRGKEAEQGVGLRTFFRIVGQIGRHTSELQSLMRISYA